MLLFAATTGCVDGFRRVGARLEAPDRPCDTFPDEHTLHSPLPHITLGNFAVHRTPLD